MYVYTLWLFNIAMERSTIFKFGKPSISIHHGFHGYASHNQRVCIYIYIIGTWSNLDELSWPAQRHAQHPTLFSTFFSSLPVGSSQYHSWTGPKKTPLCHPIYVFFFSDTSIYIYIYIIYMYIYMYIYIHITVFVQSLLGMDKSRYWPSLNP